MIYFVQPVDGGPIKIGTTINLESRLKQLEAHYGCPLALLATMTGDAEREREIHDQFSHLRLGRTEQFQPADDLLAFIGRPLFACAGEVTEIPVTAAVRPLMTVKGRQAWFEWLKRFSEHAGLPISNTLDVALKHYAEHLEFDEPMPRRGSR